MGCVPIGIERLVWGAQTVTYNALQRERFRLK